MPRKQNGFGNPKSLGFKGAGRVDRGKGVGAPGSYPSNRGYGSSVTRTVIEKYNLDSDWVKWRKGYEYYNQAAWYKLQTLDELNQVYTDSQIQSKLYQGTPYEIDVVFDGYKFATTGADSNNHYVMKRTPLGIADDSYESGYRPVDLGTVVSVKNDLYKYPENKQRKEIWMQGNPGPDSRLLLQMVGDRITDGETEATVTHVLNADEKPAMYVGKSWENLTTVEVVIPLGDILYEPGVDPIEIYERLVGEVVYIPDFFVEKDKSLVDSLTFRDGINYFAVDLEDEIPNATVEILDAVESVLPPSLFDISTLPKLFSSTNATVIIKGSYIYNKQDYQRFFGRQLLTADVVDDETDLISYSILPFTIIGVDVQNGNLIIKSVPAKTEVKLLAAAAPGATVILSDYSFTKRSIDEYNGRYYHTVSPDEDLWIRLDTEVDPWMDEVFTTGNPLQPAVLYTCSCPNHAHSILSAPQSTQDEATRKINRQRRYPLPTVQGANDFDSLGRNQAAGKIESWETKEHKMGFKMCKHSIAAMFIEHLKVKEPNQYPTQDAREGFEEKLRKEIGEVAEEFKYSYERGGITTLEIIFALAQGLNLDDVETAYVILNSNF